MRKKSIKSLQFELTKINDDVKKRIGNLNIPHLILVCYDLETLDWKVEEKYCDASGYCIKEKIKHYKEIEEIEIADEYKELVMFDFRFCPTEVLMKIAYNDKEDDTKRTNVYLTYE